MENAADIKAKNQGKRYEVSLYEDELLEMKPGKSQKKKEQKPALFYIGYVGQVGFVIAIPIAGGTLIGGFLDTKWGTYPKMTMTGLCIGLVISIFNFVAVIKEIIAGSKK